MDSIGPVFNFMSLFNNSANNLTTATNTSSSKPAIPLHTGTDSPIPTAALNSASCQPSSEKGTTSPKPLDTPHSVPSDTPHSVPSDVGRSL